MKKNRFFLIVTHQTRLARKIFIAPSLHKFLSKRDQTRKANRSHRLAGNVNRLVEVSQHISNKIRRIENAASQCHEKITFFYLQQSMQTCIFKRKISIAPSLHKLCLDASFLVTNGNTENVKNSFLFYQILRAVAQK